MSLMHLAAGILASGVTPRANLAASRDISDTAVSPTNASCGYRLTSAGNEQEFEGVGAPWSTFSSPWFLLGAAADYELYFELISGDTPSGSAVNTWLAGDSDPSWSLTDTTTTGGAVQCSANIKMRKVGGSELQSVPRTLYAEKTI